MTILIDDRAGSNDLGTYSCLSHATTTRLAAGDVHIVGNGPDGPVNIGVEVKSIDDFLSSVDNGRLSGRQIPDMIDEFDILWLVVYGRIMCSASGRLLVWNAKKRRWRKHTLGKRQTSYNAVESALLSYNSLGVQSRFVEHKAQVANWLSILHAWWDKPWDRHHALHSFDRSRAMGMMPHLDKTITGKAKFALSLDGVGYKLAIQAAHTFASIYDMVVAGPEEWASIDGVGKVIANSVIDAMHRRS